MSDSGKLRRERDAEVARKAILDAAEEIFAQEGFDGARIDAIAEASGYNKSLIFHYFEDKLRLAPVKFVQSSRRLFAGTSTTWWSTRASCVFWRGKRLSAGARSTRYSQHQTGYSGH